MYQSASVRCFGATRRCSLQEPDFDATIARKQRARPLAEERARTMDKIVNVEGCRWFVLPAPREHRVGRGSLRSD